MSPKTKKFSYLKRRDTTNRTDSSTGLTVLSKLASTNIITEPSCLANLGTDCEYAEKEGWKLAV